MRRLLSVLALFGALTLGFTYPLVFHLTSRAPTGEAWTYDGFSLLWNLWWFKHALLVLNANPFYTDSIFSPLGVPLALHSYTVFSDLVAIPLLPFASVVTASNLILLASLVLSGFGMYLLALYVLARSARPVSGLALHGAAFVAGVVFAFSSERFVLIALGHYNFVTTQFAPFYLLYLLKSLDRPGARAPLLAALFLALNILVELSLGVLLILFSVLYWALARRAAAGQRLRALANMAVVFALAALIASPYLLPAVRESFDPRYIPQYWGGAPVLSADLLSLFAPSSLSTFFGTHDWPREWLQVILGQARFFDVNIFVIGVGVAVLAILGAILQSPARRWLGVALILVVLALGPVLHVNKQATFDLDGLSVTVGLPYIALHYVPILNGLRAPQRFAVVATIAFALPAGFAAHWLLSRLARRPLPGFALVAVAAGLAAFAGAEHLLVPIPLHAATIPRVYARIAQEPGQFTIMDVPLGWRSGFGPIGTENTQLQYYQVAHEKNLISGFAARTPSFIFDYFERQPILNALAVLESEGRLPQDEAVHDKSLAAELAYFFDLRYILIHPPSDAPTPYTTTAPRVRAYVLEVFDVDELDSADDITLYRVNQPEPRTHFVVDFGSAASSLNRAEGWERDEQVSGASANWMSGREARAFVPLRTAGSYRLTVRALPLVYAGQPAQTLGVRWNGQVLVADLRLANGWQEYAVDIPAGAVRSGLNELTFTAGSAAVPADVLPGSTDRRSLSVAVDWLKFDLQ